MMYSKGYNRKVLRAPHPAFVAAFLLAVTLAVIALHNLYPVPVVG
jgi:hypothetical protein